jgi:uncharacterized protein (DUF885 family)
MNPRAAFFVVSIWLFIVPQSARAQSESPAARMPSRVIRYEEDRDALRRYWPLSVSEAGAARMREFFEGELASLRNIDFDGLSQEDRVDYVLLRTELENELEQLELRAVRRAQTRALLPYSNALLAVLEPGQRLEPRDPARLAAELDRLQVEARDAREKLGDLARAEKRSVVLRAAREVEELRGALSKWLRERDGYDPLFSWWATKPAERLREALDAHARWLRDEIAKVPADDDETIVGDPIGREALLAELRGAWIPYSPEDLLEIADRELAWCERELVRAAQDMGLGDDWRAALERAKQDHVAPGEQPALIRELAEEATRWVEEQGLVTVPSLAKETWRMEMMTPERQLVNPFFTGGEVISVSFPTHDMDHERKQMSLRGNNRHFSRATVHHELIPGHHLQQFMTSRYATHRRVFATPFWTEGWALWWELLMWERGFQKSPENRMGMLFWRTHRCARIRFSLSFHLGLWSPQECIDFLVERVGHERENAAGEVRRSFNGSYGPLYQIAYMVGALQLRELHRELVVAGKMSARDFHDAVLQGGNMPIELVRARLAGTPLTREQRTSWRFYESAR